MQFSAPVYTTDWTTLDGDGHEHLDDINDEGFYESNDDYDHHDKDIDEGNDDNRDNPNHYDEVDLDKDYDVDLNHHTDLNQNSVNDFNDNDSQHQAQNVDDTSDMGSGANIVSCSGGKFFFIVTMLWLVIY